MFYANLQFDNCMEILEMKHVLLLEINVINKFNIHYSEVFLSKYFIHEKQFQQ